MKPTPFLILCALCALPLCIAWRLVNIETMDYTVNAWRWICAAACAGWWLSAFISVLLYADRDVERQKNQRLRDDWYCFTRLRDATRPRHLDGDDWRLRDE